LPAFLKNPKFIAGAIVALWVVYVVSKNFQLDPIKIWLLPWVSLQLKVSAVIIGAGLFGSLLTLAIQYQWRRWKSSNPTAVSSAADSNKTVA
jgi:hypothetical protein